MNVLSFIQVILCVMIYVNYFIRSIPKYKYRKIEAEDDTNKKLFESFKNAMTFLKRLILDTDFLYNSLYLLMALLGNFIDPFFFSFHLLEVIRRSSTLINVINAFWYPKKQIIVTLILFIMVEYVFTIFVFLFFGDQALDEHKHRFCNEFDRCLVTIIDYTFKEPNGIINKLSPQGKEEGFYLGGRFWIDNLFAIILIMLILQMLAGIIVDNFSALREAQQRIFEDKFNICFICGLHKNDLNKLYGNEEGYNEHIKLDHNYWNYLFLIMNLLNKEVKDLSGMDYDIFTNYVNQSFTWIPFEKYF